MTRALRAVLAGFVVALSVGVVAAMSASAHRLHQASLLPAKFKCTNAEQTYSVPAGVRALKVKAVGAAGAPSFGAPIGSGGQGAVVGAWVRLPGATSTVYVEVGCTDLNGNDGFNGGGGGSGTANGGSGGGASDVRLDPMSTPLTTSDTRLVVAGGGGGGGVCSDAGGAAGDTTVTGAGKGGNGTDSGCSGGTAGGNGGFGGTAGGSGGSGTLGDGCDGGAGSLGQGASIPTGCDGGDIAGGGGGGYYGGGGGGEGVGGSGGGGGAGSSFWVSSATHTSMGMNTTSLAPKVVLTPACLVPNLKGKTLAQAKTALTHRHCALGTVTKKTSTGTPGIVLSQNPKAGTILTLGSKVAVVVSKT